MNRYQNTKTSFTNENKPFYDTTLYPEIPLSVNDIYIITNSEDRYDLLAKQYYGDPTLWWVLSLANAKEVDQSSIFIPSGEQIRIPIDVSEILSQFQILNS
jgi:hypothetical protein